MENIKLLEQIIFEKRKRHQTYMALDYFLAVNTYFDFFSPEAFKIIKHSTQIANLITSEVNLELLFLSYSFNDSKIDKLLSDKLPSLKNKETLNSKKKIFPENHPKFINESFFSNEVLQVFEKSLENALRRFKTPVITAEILLVTLMEEKGKELKIIFKKCFPTDMEWYLYRYHLIKLIHNQESTIRSEITTNQQYFAYLMKTQLQDSEFNSLVENSKLAEGVFVFRNSLILKTLELNILNSVLSDIKNSIKVTNNRKYSF
jgi:hypothetical protein